MKKVVLLCVLVSALTAFLLAFTYQARAYPHDVYEYHRTNQIGFYLDRLGGYIWEKVPIITYERPMWVNLIRSDLGAVGFIGLITGVAIAGELVVRQRRKKLK